MRLGIGHLVRVGGGKFGEEKAQILRGADAFIQCSRTEGLPLGPLEALSWGLPCLLTAGVGLGGSVLDAGAGDTCDTSVRGIAEMLERFLEGYPQKAPAFRAAARALAARFDEAVAAEGAVACYARVTGEKR
jgi:glycosyltransferase involved in cell wall biosynthesis